MKRLLFSLLALAAVGAVAATGTLPDPVRDAVETAIRHEQEAVARYQAFAVKADEEGYPGAAALFRAQAASEGTHQKRFTKALEAKGLTVTIGELAAPKVWSTAENIRSAAAAETAERDVTYREAIRLCSAHRVDDVGKLFDQTRDSEVEHVNLCNGAARDLQSLKTAKTFYVCDGCGYTTDIKLGFCPACQMKHPLKAIE